MFRFTVFVLALGITTDVGRQSPSAAWPLRVFVTDPRGRPVSFSAITLGGTLIMKVGGDDYMPVVRPLARGDTLRATTPAQYPLNLEGGAIVFFSGTRDSVHVIVGRNPFGEYDRVAADGRRLTVRQVNGKVVIEAQ